MKIKFEVKVSVKFVIFAFVGCERVSALGFLDPPRLKGGFMCHTNE